MSNDDPRDIREITDELLTIHELNQNLANRLEVKENEIRDMTEFIADLTEQNNEKNNAIAKASKVIESLKDELEKAKNDIKFLELDKQKLAQDNRLAEKELMEIQKELMNYDNLKKAEARGKVKIQKLKDEIEDLTQSYNRREQDLLQKIDDIQADNKRMEMRMQDTDAHAIEVQDKYTMKDKQFLDSVDRISALENENQRLLDEIQNLKRERENLETNHARELRMVKKEAENNIRYYKTASIRSPLLQFDVKNKENEFYIPDSQLVYHDQSNVMNVNDVSAISEQKSFIKIQNELIDNQLDESAISHRPSFKKTATATKLIPVNKKKAETMTKSKLEGTKRTLKVERAGSENLHENDDFSEIDKKRIGAGLKNNVDFFKAALAESVERENNLVQYIEKHISKEAESVNKISETVLQKEVTLRPEIERWMMRNEELEQRLFDYVQKITILEIMVKDSKTALEISQHQRSQEKQLSEQVIRELESLINFLYIEIEEKNKVIINLFPEFENEFVENVNDAQDKMLAVYSQYKTTEEDLNRVRREKNDLFFHFEDLKKKHQELLDYYYQLKQNLTSLGGLFGLDAVIDTMESPDESPESEANAMQAKHEAITQKIQELFNTKKEYEVFQDDTATEKDKLNAEIDNLEREIRDLIGEKNLSQKEKIALQDDLAKLEDIVKDLNIKLEDSRRKTLAVEKEKHNISERLFECDREILALRGDLTEKGVALQELTTQLESLESDLKQKTIKIENLMSQTDVVVEEKQDILDRLTNVNNDYVQTVELLEKTLKDFDNAQNDLESYKQELRLKEEEAEDFRQHLEDLEMKLEDFEDALREKDRQLTAASIAIEHKTSTIEMLEEKFRETRENEENLRTELTKMKVELFSESSNLRNELMNTQQQMFPFHSRLPSRDLGQGKGFESGTGQIKQSPYGSTKELTEREHSGAVTEDLKKLEGTEVIDDKLKAKERLNYERKIEEFEKFLEYVQSSLRNISEDNIKLYQDPISQEKVQEIISENPFLADLYVGIKQALKSITFKLQDLQDSEARFVSRLTQLLLDRPSLSLQDRKILEDQCAFVLDHTSKNNIDSRHITSTLKDQVMNILKTDSINYRQSTIQNISGLEQRSQYRQTTEDIFPVNFSKVASHLNSLYAHFTDKASLIKPVLEKLYKTKKTISRNKSEIQESGFINLIEEIMSMTQSTLDYLQEISSSEAKIIRDLSLTLKDTGFQSFAPEENHIGAAIEETMRVCQEALSKCYEGFTKIDKDCYELMRNYSDPEKHSSNLGSKTLKDSKIELKNQAFQLLKEFYAEIGDVIKIFSKYSSKLDSKSRSKYHDISTLGEEPASIFKALEENLAKNNNSCIDTLRKEFAEYLDSEGEIGEESQEFLQKIFNFRTKLFNIDKLEDEVSNFKNVFKLLDISWLFKEAKRDDSQYLLNYDQIRNRSFEANKTIEKIIETLPLTMLKTWHLIAFDKKSLNTIEDPQKLYDKLRNTYSDPNELAKKGSSHKTHIRYQIVELLRENGGSRIAMNCLLYVFYKFKIIINDLSKEDL